MLAQNFKTAADLNLTEAEWGAAIHVLGMLERAELQHDPCKVDGDHKHMPTVAKGFNMECSGRQTDCGTVACIGGWMAIMMGRRGTDINYYVNTVINPGLTRLFWGCTKSDTTPAQAALALRSYLTTGDARWDLAMAD